SIIAIPLAGPEPEAERFVQEPVSSCRGSSDSRDTRTFRDVAENLRENLERIDLLCLRPKRSRNQLRRMVAFTSKMTIQDAQNPRMPFPRQPANEDTGSCQNSRVKRRNQ